jgi:hypothetical protein
MQNEFEKELIAMNREILALKQQREKSANIFHTQTTDLTLNFDLEIAGQFDLYVRSDKMAVIDIDIGTNNPLLGLTFNVNGLDDRIIRNVQTYNNNNGHIGYLVYIYSNNATDMSTLAGGGSVSLTYNASISSTAAIIPTVTYQDLWVS